MTGAVEVRAQQPAASDVDPKITCVDASSRAQRLRDQGKLVEADKELLVCAAATCPAVVAKDCAQWRDEVRAKMPTVVVVARDARGQDVIDARVLVDGAVVVDRLDGREIPLDPGAHVLRVEPRDPALAPAEEQLLATEGVKTRALNVVLSSASAPAPAAPPTGSSTAATERPSGEGARSSIVLPAAVLVVGGAALATGVVLFAVGSGKVSDANDACPNDVCSSAAYDDASSRYASGQRLKNVSLVVGGAGVAALAVGAALLVLRSGSSTTTSSHLAAAPLVDPASRTAGVSARAVF